MRTVTARALSHDNLYHTVLGAMGVRTARYSRSLDAMAACRQGRTAAADPDDAR